MTSEVRVFISYSRDDRPFVERLSADLRHYGVQTWVDVENIKPGARWDEALADGLKDSTALIFVLSGNMVGSKWMILELQHFVECVVQGRRPLVSAHDGYRALRLAADVRERIKAALSLS